ncbi:MAG: hypothetical protein WBB49_04225 [Microgenomates group bacterium]|jgi:hypothetical protein
MATRLIEFCVNGPANAVYSGTDYVLKRAREKREEGSSPERIIATVLLPYLVALEISLGLGVDLTGGRLPIHSLRDVVNLASPRRLYTHS